MTHIVDAIYEHGTLKLAHPLDLPENTAVKVSIEPAAPAPERAKPKYEIVEADNGLLVVRTFDGRKITNEMVRALEAE